MIRFMGLIIVMASLSNAQPLMAPVTASAAVVEATDSTYLFADWLYQQGDYFRAITFYKQAIFSHPGDSEFAARCYYNVGQSCLRSKQQNLAMRYFHEVIGNYPVTKAAILAKYGMGQSKFDAQGYDEAGIDFAAFRNEYPDHDRAPAALFYGALCRLGLFQWDSSRLQMAAVKERYPQSPLAGLADSLLPTMGQGLVLPRKSVALSLCLSTVFPGAGQFYSDRGKDALSVLMLEALAGLAAYYAYTHDVNRGYAYTWTGIFGVLHLANMYGAFNTAQNANKIIDYNQQEKVREKINEYLRSKGAEAGLGK
jgi:TolA-binding protein